VTFNYIKRNIYIINGRSVGLELATFGLSHHILHQERQRLNSMLSYKEVNQNLDQQIEK